MMIPTYEVATQLGPSQVRYTGLSFTTLWWLYNLDLYIKIKHSSYPKLKKTTNEVATSNCRYTIFRSCDQAI